ncbi:extracellular solute-binding protein [Microbacterium sp. ASV49]|uniref:Extracellular solute-binding protein n=1 Tax=Microbacterium candidum TaxID=3041922 RepID=A0ABT7MWY6_9MICO|nr:extracellular solute-binding protein [Microbacterium sp. ASV49]MDL9978968.1 extracellular solute-binding protein [Microbacterium sp. ASV49]
MKKTHLLGGAAIAATAALALTGCGFGGGTSGGSANGTTTLNMLVPSYSDKTQANWNKVIDGFQKKYPDIKVKLQVESWDNLATVISTKIQGGQTPDIYNGGPFVGYATDGLLYKAKDVVSSSTFSDFQDAFVKNEEYKGTPYALPFIASARALFVNNDLLKQAGIAAPPKTWDEELTAAVAISKLGNGIAGYGMPLGSEEAQAEAAVWLWGGGGTFGNADKIMVSDSSNLPGGDQIKKMIDAGATEKDPGSTNRTPLLDIFIQGKIGMQVGLPPTVGQIKEKNPSLNYSIVPIPTKDGSAMTLGVEDQLMAFKNKDDKKAAIQKFFDYFYAKDVYVPWVQSEGFLPVTKSGATALDGEADLKPFLEVLPSAKFYPSTNPKWDATDGAFKSLFGQIQTKPTQDVLNSIQAVADKG